MMDDLFSICWLQWCLRSFTRVFGCRWGREEINNFFPHASHINKTPYRVVFDRQSVCFLSSQSRGSGNRRSIVSMTVKDLQKKIRGWWFFYGGGCSIYARVNVERGLEFQLKILQYREGNAGMCVCSQIIDCRSRKLVGSSKRSREGLSVCVSSNEGSNSSRGRVCVVRHSPTNNETSIPRSVKRTLRPFLSS